MRSTNKDLQQWYRQANKWYFGNRLPKTTKLWFTHLPGLLGRTTRDSIKRKPTRTELKQRPNCVLVLEPSFRIYIDESLRGVRRHAIMTLLHEMVHCDNWKKKGHGRWFDNKMFKLAERGAFDGLW